MKWHLGPTTCPSHGWYADSGHWRITVSTNPQGYALIDKRAWDRGEPGTVFVGTKDACKLEAERREARKVPGA